MYIEALQSYHGKEPSLFLAGGITGCPDWQRDLTALLTNTPLVILNPRRAQFSPDEDAARQQIIWEHDHLRRATAISFWFPQETLCPITLYELGAWSMTPKKIFIGAHPNYQRLLDIQVQTSLVRPDIQPVTTIEDLAQAITTWADTLNQ